MISPTARNYLILQLPPSPRMEVLNHFSLGMQTEKKPVTRNFCNNCCSHAAEIWNSSLQAEKLVQA